jgi:hypothetical protein
MSTEPTVIAKKHATAKQHLAGLAGARAWIQDLSAAHLLSYQHPIRDEPLPDAGHDEPA